MVQKGEKRAEFEGRCQRAPPQQTGQVHGTDDLVFYSWLSLSSSHGQAILFLPESFIIAQSFSQSTPFLSFPQHFIAQIKIIKIVQLHSSLLLRTIYMIEQEKIIRVLMVGRIFEEEEVFKLIERAAAILNTTQASELYFMDEKTMNKMHEKYPHYDCVKFCTQQHAQLIDYVLTIGGDGTILYAAKQFTGQPPPFLTFQRGTLGFMCRFQESQIEDVIFRQLTYGKNPNSEPPLKKSSNMRLKVLGDKLQKVCINEVSITRKTHERINLEIYLNGNYVTETIGDGMLISTPTGSTAYSLSAGGPIVQNGVNGILLVPIAPNSLSFRPLCVSSESQITVKLSSTSRSSAYLSFDGQTITQFMQGSTIKIRTSEFNLIFLQPRKEDAKMPEWMERLKFFLGWNEKFYTSECKIKANQ